MKMGIEDNLEGHEENEFRTMARLLKVGRKYAYLEIDGFGTQKLERRKYPFLDKNAVGNCYDVKVRAIEEDEIREILSIKESLWDGRHMKDVSVDEIWKTLQRLSREIN